MKYQGRLQQWHDDKGFGFVEPNGGGERAFVHVKAFKKRTQRPVTGDLLVYRLAQDKQGRTQTVDIRFAAEHKSSVNSKGGQGRGLAKLFVILSCVFICTSIAFGTLPVWFALLYAVLSLITFIAYGRDKAKARRNQWRTPESTLHLLALLGGWPGAFLAQNKFRHKSKKGTFLFVYWLCVFANLTALIWLSSGDGQWLLERINTLPF